MGRCPECNQWHTMEEEWISGNAEKHIHPYQGIKGDEPQPLDSIPLQDEIRIKTGLGELDRVLGGGIVPASLILVGGDPGIGKSTLLLQGLDYIAQRGERVLYVSGEESAAQIKYRADRLGVKSGDILISTKTLMEDILEDMEKIKPKVSVIDSIQTIFSSQIPSSPGSVTQIRECANHIMYFSKTKGSSTFLIGHVTKEGAIAGPKVLEHLVDTVLYFEGDKTYPYRIIRAVKNRYGSTNEIGIFSMTESGLEEVSNPSEIFLAERSIGVPGSVVVSCIEGSRSILVELQALVTFSHLAIPRRTTIGVDTNKVALLVAVLEKKLGFDILRSDIYLNVAGGMRITEPATDLGILLAMASSFLNKSMDPQTIVLGEVGLSGEVRGVYQTEGRIKEAARLGFKKCLMPRSNRERLTTLYPIEIIGVDSVEKAIKMTLR